MDKDTEAVLLEDIHREQGDMDYLTEEDICRRALRNRGKINRKSMGEYVETGGYMPLSKSRKMQREKLSKGGM